MKKEMINPPFYFKVALLIMVAVHFLFPIYILFYGIWKIIGIIPLILGIVLNLIADKKFKVNHTTVKPGQESKVLITDGVFNYTRNPMYLGMVLILISFILFLGSVTSFLIIPFFVYIINKRFIYLEEKMLEIKFGEEWLNYKEKVHKWI